MIHLLSEETINQIAAGEVIESPVSVVKELVENALDAKSSKITVEITGGGLKLIRIIDDGIGMDQEDAKLSIVRHATSKISKPDDLFALTTKGFRGEALASMASISSMTIVTAQEKGSGVELEVEKGAIVKIRPRARTRGTTIEVRSLFYNVPARKKFQKSAAAIGAEIFRLVTVMSLSHPEVDFELISNGRKVVQTFGTSGVEERAKVLLGEDFVAGSFPLHFEEEGFTFSGLIGSPTNTRPNKTQQYLYLNQRAVQCPEIGEAIRQGYGTRLDEKRHPLFLLHVNLPLNLVDVNVHPQKLFVRLRDEVVIQDKIQRAVEKALSKWGEKRAFSSFTPSFSYKFEEVKEAHVAPLLFKEEQETLQSFAPVKEWVEVMGVLGHYLFVQEEEGVTLVDLQRAQGRVLFESLLSQEGKTKEKQGLLIPLTFSLTPLEIAMILTHQEAIEEMGFSFIPLNEKEFKIDAIPSYVDEGDVKEIFSAFANQLREYIGKGDYKKEREKALARIVLRFARSKKVYTKEEGKRLYEKLSVCESPLFCPKGNPTKVRLDDERLEALFREAQKAPNSIKS